jgi:anaerobic magnesium-protoporphyrin IX monomethyl ester cyclase
VARILFMQNMPFEYMGPMYLSAQLKRHGHACRLLVVEKEREIWGRIREYGPDLVAFSTMTGPHRWVLRTAEEVKRHVNARIVLGGAHPTFFPEVIYETAVDIICRGEGEFALLELADRIDRREEIDDILNLWVKNNGQVTQNALRPLVGELDTLPFPDRSLYDDCEILRSVPAMKFLTGRGCPYRCTFCFNHRYNQLYRGLGRMLRKRSVGGLICEIEECVESYRLELIRFPDDTLTGNKSWLLEFLSSYERRIGLPFTGLARANELDEEVVCALKRSGCLNVYFGVETGNEALRNRILKKNLTNRQLLEAARLLRKHGLKFGTYNIFGLPDETLAFALETISLNQALRPNYTINNIFQPYPRTEIADYVSERGLLNSDVEYLDTMNEGSILRSKEIDRLVNLCRFAYLCIRFPFLTPLGKVLSRLPPNRLFKMVYDLSSAPPMKSNLNLSWTNLIRWGIKLRNIN